METSDRLIGVGALIVCLTWSGIKISEYYFKINPPPSQITQPKKTDVVTPWVNTLVSLPVTNPDDFKYDGYVWKYKETEIWTTNGLKFVSLSNREDIKLTDIEKTTLYNAFLEWNKVYSEQAKLSYKIN